MSTGSLWVQGVCADDERRQLFIISAPVLPDTAEFETVDPFSELFPSILQNPRYIRPFTIYVDSVVRFDVKADLIGLSTLGVSSKPTFIYPCLNNVSEAIGYAEGVGAVSLQLLLPAGTYYISSLCSSFGGGGPPLYAASLLVQAFAIQTPGSFESSNTALTHIQFPSLDNCSSSSSGPW